MKVAGASRARPLRRSLASRAYQVRARFQNNSSRRHSSPKSPLARTATTHSPPHRRFLWCQLTAQYRGRDCDTCEVRTCGSAHRKGRTSRWSALPTGLSFFQSGNSCYRWCHLIMPFCKSLKLQRFPAAGLAFPFSFLAPVLRFGPNLSRA
jgi:hypothetical protein